MSPSVLPHLNAALNALSALFLLAGWRFIRSGRRRPHAACMVAACLSSLMFLVSYLVYHFQVGSVRYTGEGASRVVYFSILLSHTVLAVVNLPLVITTLKRALRGQFAEHRKLARWTLPLWAYVSITGVVIYVMLYRL